MKIQKCTPKDFFWRQKILTIKQKTPQESLSCWLECIKLETFHRFNCGSPFNFKKVLKNKNNLLSKNIKCSIFILQQQCLSLIIIKFQNVFFFTVVNIFVNFFSKTLQGSQSYHKSCNSGNSWNQVREGEYDVCHAYYSLKMSILFQYSRQL